MTKRSKIKPDKVVNVISDICPIPLIEARKALSASKTGEIIEIIGTHEASKREIPLAIESSGNSVLRITERDGIWHIFIQKA